MAEITKVTTPMIPRENLGSKNKPVTDQAFELTDPSKVHRPGQDGSKIMDQQRDGSAVLRDSIGREMMAPLLKTTTDLVHAFQKITVLLQMGISTSEIMNNAEVRELLEAMYLQPEQLAQALKEQDASAVLFKGAAFDVLRDVMAKFEGNPKITNAVAHLLKTFEQNVNTDNSIKTILLTCRNLLDYMFSKDRAQFSDYLQGLSDMLLPEVPPEAVEGAAEKAAQQQADGDELPQQPAQEAAPEAGKQADAAKLPEGARTLGVDQREAAQILKGNLLPLLGEIVVKYNQNDKIRDMVMVVVHNIVRVDQGSDDALQEAVTKLISELRILANLPENFEKQLTDAVMRSSDLVKDAQDNTMSRLTEIIARTLSSPTANPATLRQAETLLLSLLQNQSSMMNVLHFILPMETDQGKLFAEMYVDPDNEERVGRSQDNSRKIFLAFESDSLGNFELSFLEAAERVDFQMWCPEILVKNLSAMKRQIADIMQVHGYTMNSYQVAELVAPHSIADVFPKLMDRRMGVDVRI